MADDPTPDEKGEKKTPKKREAQNPVYTVVEITSADPETLVVVQRGVSAKNQEAACDHVVANLPEDRQKRPYGAFLTRSFQDFDYEPEVRVELHKKPRQPRDE